METPTTISDLNVGDTVLRPFYKTVETVVAISPRTPRSRTYLCVRFASGHSWTNHRDYQMTKIA